MTKGMSNGEIMRCRHYEFQLNALDKIRQLRQRIDEETALDIARELDTILQKLDYDCAP